MESFALLAPLILFSCVLKLFDETWAIYPRMDIPRSADVQRRDVINNNLR